MKSKLILSICLLLNFYFTFAQDRYVVHFANKNNSPYAINNPLQYLSQRAIDRRTKQGISIDQTDFPVNPNYISGVAATGATILNTSRWLNTATIQITNPSQLNAIGALPYVTSVGNVGRVGHQKNGKVKFNDEIYNIPHNINAGVLRANGFNYGQATGQTQMISMDALHNLGYAGEGMLIALLDGGFLDANIMPALDSVFANNQVLATWDFVSNDANVYDDNWHGSSVFSCIAANVPGEMVGTAPHAQFLLLRSEDVNSEYIIEEYNYASAAEYADSAGADVIHSSLGYTTFDDSSQDHTYADMNGNTAPATIAADMAAKKGIIVTSSAGNEGNSPWNYISVPADGDSVLTVGSVDQMATYSAFSSNGPSSDGRIKPDVAAVGGGTFLYMPFNPAVVQANGTSFSGPIIAGAAACLWQSWPSKKNMEIVQAIKRSANQFFNPDTLLGYGIPNFSVAYSVLSLGEINFPSNESLHLYPNPVLKNNVINAYYFSTIKDTIRITLTDAAGKTLFINEAIINAGYSEISLPKMINSGLYIVSIRSNIQNVSKRFIVK
ncbi:MAG: S8 family peptidase [Bacteroidota bacterium]